MDNNTILDVKNLSVAFNGRTVVDNISYTLERGRTLGIVGESGSGKSVSTLAMMGLLPKNAQVTGSAKLGDISLLDLDEEGFRAIRGSRISMIFQEPMTSLNPVQRCGDQVMEMLRLHEKVTVAEARERVLNLFNEVLLPRSEKIFTSYPHEISGGQKQRVMIAMALICNPDVVIADEPTTALDVTVQKTILELLRQLQRKHQMSVIFITHDLGVVAQVADDIAVMYQGRIVEHGSAKDIFSSPREPYTQGLLACRPPMEGRPKRLLTVADFMEGSQSPVLSGGSWDSGLSGISGLSGLSGISGLSGSSGLSETSCALQSITPAEAGERAKRAIAEGDTPILSVRDLGVTFALERNFFGKPRKQLKAVEGMSFDVYRGETFGLVGESGCGKTTLGRAILRLVESSSGSVTFDGKRLDKLSASEMRRMRRKIQIVFQDPYSSLNPRMTVGQAIMEPLMVDGVLKGRAAAKERTVELMERVGLKPEWFDRYPHEFSGGQRQRVCIARALVVEPELVICDESVSALDVSVQAQVLNLLNELKDKYGYTYIFISHDLGVVHFVSDRIMVMRGGRLVEMADSDQLFSHPHDEYTQRLLNAIPRIQVS